MFAAIIHTSVNYNFTTFLNRIPCFMIDIGVCHTDRSFNRASVHVRRTCSVYLIIIGIYTRYV